MSWISWTLNLLISAVIKVSNIKITAKFAEVSKFMSFYHVNRRAQIYWLQLIFRDI